MALTKISTGGVKDDAASQAKIADEAIDEARLQISNAGSNGQFLSKQSGNTGGLTWATPPDTNTQVGGATGVDFNDNTKARFGTGNDLEIYHDGSHDYVVGSSNELRIKSPLLRLRASNDDAYITCVEDGATNIYHDNTKKFETTAAGVTVSGTVTDSKGDVRDVKVNAQGGTHTLVLSDAGTCIKASGNVTVPNSVFSQANVVSVINNTSGDLTIIQGSGVTMYNSADASTGNRTLSSRGMATMIFDSASVCYISGAGLS